MCKPRSGGTGVSPVRSEKISRRHLPHWQIAGAVYFLTWRCAAGVTLIEAERDIALAAIRHWDAIRWDVLTALVMPDHVHVLACPMSNVSGYWDLSELMHSVKSFSAHEITNLRKRQRMGGASSRSASIWQDERYDRWMRDDEELVEKWEYIVGNPVTAGLVTVPEQYPWLYQKKTGAMQTQSEPVPPTDS